MEIHRASPVPHLPPAALFSRAQIETRDPGLVADRDPPTVWTESQRGTFPGRTFENRFAALPPPHHQLAILVEPGEKAPIRAEREFHSGRVREHAVGFQTLEFAVVRDGANADRAVLPKASIALVKRVIGESLRVRIPGLPDWPALNIRNRHGGNRVVSHFGRGPDARCFCKRSETFETLAHLAAVAASLRLALERNEELLARSLLTVARGFQRRTAL